MKHVLVPLCDFGGRYEPRPNDTMDFAETRTLIQVCAMYQTPNILEIGTYRGVTTGNLARVAKSLGGSVTTVDVSSIPSTMPRNQTGECLRRHLIGAEIPCDVRSVVNQVIIDPEDPEALDKVCKFSGPFDVVFIDGDHSYEGVKRDFNCTMKHMSRHGVILLHDIWWDHNPPPVDGPMLLSKEIDLCVINLTHLGMIESHLERVFPIVCGGVE